MHPYLITSTFSFFSQFPYYIYNPMPLPSSLRPFLLFPKSLSKPFSQLISIKQNQISYLLQMKPIEMESKAPILAKKVCNMVRVMFFMMRKGIFKSKLMMDLDVMLKRRGKLAGKAIANLMSHHHHHHHHGGSHHSHLQSSAPREYEFSCSNTPNAFSFPAIGKRHRHFFACVHAPPTQDDDAVTVNAVKTVLEMLNNDVKVEMTSSPALPGFGRSPMVRQLRVTDSPFPLRDSEQDNDHQVDKAAEEFIKRFYKELKKQD